MKWTSPYHQRMKNTHPFQSGAMTATFMKCDEHPQILISFKTLKGRKFLSDDSFDYTYPVNIYKWWWEWIYDEKILYSVTRLLCILCAWRMEQEIRPERLNILCRKFSFIQLYKDSWLISFTHKELHCWCLSNDRLKLD